MLQITKQVQLKKLTTFNVSAIASNFIQLDSVEAILQAMPLSNQFSRRLVLGGGSNILFVGDYQGLILYPQLFGIELLSEDERSCRVSVGASENWHNWVLKANLNGWHGLENLALIPGTVGAAPVQNIGAYGVEIQQLVHQVQAIDLANGETVFFNNQACKFAYRDSLFKRSGQGKYLVTRVEFNLKKQADLCLEYQPLAEYFADKHEVTALQVLERVCNIRQQKLPNPAELPNAGSFFKNPVIAPSHFEKLQKEYPGIVAYPVENGVKLAAGWLIDKAGYRGLRVGDVGVHRHQALVLVNYGESDGQKIWQLASQIQQAIRQKYAIELEPEVRVEGEVAGGQREASDEQ